jgi:hypothetical protein
MDDIVERLLNAAGEIFPGRFMSFDGPLITEAASEIQRLRAALNCVVSELLPVHDHWGEFDHHEVVAHFLEEARDG